MLDPHGFVATCNSTNFFIVRKVRSALSRQEYLFMVHPQRKGEVWAPTTKYQLHGITRAHVLRMCEEHGIPVRELDFSLTKVYSADEAFVTGTFAGQVPVVAVDGRVVGDGTRGPVVERLQQLYRCGCCVLKVAVLHQLPAGMPSRCTPREKVNHKILSCLRECIHCNIHSTLFVAYVSRCTIYSCRPVLISRRDVV